MWSPPVAAFDPALNLRRSNCGPRGMPGQLTADKVTAACVPGRGWARGVRPIDAPDRAAVGATSGRPRGGDAARARECRWRGRTWATQTKVVLRDPARSRVRIRQGRRAPAGGRPRVGRLPRGGTRRGATPLRLGGAGRGLPTQVVGRGVGRGGAGRVGGGVWAGALGGAERARGGAAAAQARPGARRLRAAGRERATSRRRRRCRLRARGRDPRGRLLRAPRRRSAPGRAAGAARLGGWRRGRRGGGWMRGGPDLRAG